jgi:2-iminobutanoate/2-iminopropanoate deaminase
MKKIIPLFLFSFCINAVAADLEYFPSPRPTAPFSEAVRFGDVIFLSGRLGLIDGKLAEGIEGQTRAAMESIKSSVEKYGSSMDRIVKCTVFMTDMAEFTQMSETYLSYFENNKPARSAVGVAGLGLGAAVEIECIAAAND